MDNYGSGKHKQFTYRTVAVVRERALLKTVLGKTSFEDCEKYFQWTKPMFLFRSRFDPDCRL
jgi:hypothetical protein